MIHVPKPPHMAPREFLIAARAESREALAFYRRLKRAKKSFPFKAYRNKQLKAALEKLFNKKCAYCEALYETTGYLEVEHYRPKKIYYWLAADWSNLLPSCKRCNNGKLSKFPLANPGKAARRKGQERREAPLLLNPSETAKARRPEKHLTFDVEDGTVQATLIGKKPSPMGTASIEVYRLSRTVLSQQRKEWARRVRSQLRFNELAQRRGTAADREFTYQDLKHLVEPFQPFRALTLKILRENGFKT